MASGLRIACLREGHSRLRNKGDETSKCMLRMLLGSRADLMLKATVTGWRGVTSTAARAQLAGGTSAAGEPCGIKQLSAQQPTAAHECATPRSKDDLFKLADENAEDEV